MAVSTLNHWRILENYTGTFEQLCDVILENNGTHFGPYFRHVLSYWEQRNSAENLLIVTYEDMQRDLESVVCKVASFLGIGISDVDLKRLVDHLTFKNMKSNPSVNYDKDLKVKMFFL